MESAATAQEPSRSRRKHPDLLFEWIGSKGHRWRLVVFLNLSLALHVACFYAFQVVYPQPIRQRVETTKITFLDPRNPDVREVIGRIEDRAIFFDGSLRLPLSEVPEAEVVFEPGFARQEPSLRLPDSTEALPTLPQIYAVDEIFFPRRSRLLPGAEPTGRPAPFEGPYLYRPTISMSSGFPARKPLGGLDWSQMQETLAAAAGNRIRFLIEVDAAGRITTCLPWAGVEPTFDEAIAHKLEVELRFEPAQLTSHGWLELSW